MKLYRVTYKEPNEFLVGQRDCEKLSVGKDADEAMRRVIKTAGREAECFDAEEVKDVLGYSIVVGNNQQQEIYSEMLKERIRQNYEDLFQSKNTIPIEKKYIVDIVQSTVFKFDEEEARVLLQFKNPLTVMYENMDFDDSTYFAEALFNMEYEMQGIDILTQKYELDKEMLLPETLHRHQAINYLIETIPNFSAKITAYWIINYKLSNEESDCQNPYEKLKDDFELVKATYGEDILYRLYDAAANSMLFEEELMFSAEFLSNGGREDELNMAIREFNQDEGMTMQ